LAWIDTTHQEWRIEFLQPLKMGIESPTLGIYDITQNYDDIEHGTQQKFQFQFEGVISQLAYSELGFSIISITKKSQNRWDSNHPQMVYPLVI
jgi:hypothetical protein